MQTQNGDVINATLIRRAFVWLLWSFVDSETEDCPVIISGFWWTSRTLQYRM